MMTFVVIENKVNARKGMVGNTALVALGVQNIHNYTTQEGYSDTIVETEEEENKESKNRKRCWGIGTSGSDSILFGYVVNGK